MPMIRGTVISFCDRTGNMVLPWLENGYRAITVDLQMADIAHPNRIHIAADCGALGSDFVRQFAPITAAFAFPPCTNLAVSGARWFADKGLKGLIDGLRIVEACRHLCETSGAPWMLENPVSTIASYWRKPDYTFHPYEFTEFEPADNYTKKTCLWTGNGFVMPKPAPAPGIGKPDDRIHKAPPSDERGNIRSATPLGFARAVYQANAPHLKKEAA